ncbi:hypothetical protein F4556_000932 [Kitasatospora gansuensis]|uniref:Polymerase nucleotidyl transferase domain-containing protein n=1 Tax=Kitasatospora gansuensis TaxID=258050 RepID=A0A7W7S8B1_9ACTN|nr:nucleotidyltransferase domain-containing protein [Kitasatospora gansuensis]MBB4945397.1 hypothetical protein [Kitasatospora gansuensis]
MSDPIVAARQVVQDRFPEAVAAFLGGSTARGEGTATSDLDIVVIRPEPGEVYRETVRHAGWPVEFFVQTPASLRTMLAWDRANGVPTIASMCAHGLTLLDRDGTAGQFRALAEQTLAAGPAPVAADTLETRRYLVTDLHDDLLGAADQDELLVIAALLLDRTAELLLSTGGHWQGVGKWLPRRLRAAHPDLADQLLTGHRTLARGGSRTPFAEAVTAALAHCGGPLQAGYRRAASPELLAGPTTG